MTARNKVICQKINDLILWGESSRDQQFFVIDEKGTISSQQNSKKQERQPRIIIIENRCSHGGWQEIDKMISTVEWECLTHFVLITDDFSQIQKLRKSHPVLAQGRSEMYGIDPDYYFSLVPLGCKNHKRIELFILARKNCVTLADKIKFFLKKSMIVLGCSERLYEQFVFLHTNPATR